MKHAKRLNVDRGCVRCEADGPSPSFTLRPSAGAAVKQRLCEDGATLCIHVIAATSSALYDPARCSVCSIANARLHYPQEAVGCTMPGKAGVKHITRQVCHNGKDDFSQRSFYSRFQNPDPRSDFSRR